MISLADLRSRDIRPSWQEAVAVLQELIQTVAETTGSAEHLPDLEHIALIPNGDVVSLPGSPTPEHPVQQAAVMLRLMMDGITAPPELDQFIERNLTVPPQYDTVAEFSRNLAFFERPGRRSDVERLVGRAVDADQTSRADEELRRLKEKAIAATPTFGSEPEETRRPKRPAGGPAAVAAMVLIAAAAAGAVWWWNQRAAAASMPTSTEAAAVPGEAAPGAGSRGNPGAGADPVPASDASPSGADDAVAGGSPRADAAPAGGLGSLLDRTKEVVRGAVRAVVGEREAAEAPVLTEAKEEPTPARRRVRPRRPSREDPVPTAVSPAPVVKRTAPSDPPAISVPEAAEAAPVLSPGTLTHALADPDAVYSAADDEVEPPVLMRPVMPKEPPPGVPPEKVGTLRVLVDRNGDVEQVRLVSPANRYHDRMIVSAAKVWKFRPAYKDGEPVRCWTTIRLTL